MVAYHDAGFTTWNLADPYGPAEDFIGEFRRLLGASRGAEALSTMPAFTTWAPRPGRMTQQLVEENRNRRLAGVIDRKRAGLRPQA